MNDITHEHKFETACITGNIHYVKNELQKNRNYDIDLFYIFEIACLYNQTDIIQYLLLYEKEHTLKFTTLERKYLNLLFKACKHEHLEVVKYYIKNIEKINIVNAYYDINRSIFDYVCKCNRTDIIKYLLNIDRKTKNNITQDYLDCGFESACVNGHIKVARFLISYCFEKNIILNVNYCSILRKVCFNNFVRIAKYLIFLIKHKSTINKSFEFTKIQNGEFSITKQLVFERILNIKPTILFSQKYININTKCIHNTHYIVNNNLVCGICYKYYSFDYNSCYTLNLFNTTSSKTHKYRTKRKFTDNL